MGGLTIHASSVAIEDSAVLFAGVSGAGKSTLAACFAGAGFRCLSDDGAQLEREGAHYAVRPNDSSIRLWQDSLEAFRSAGSLSSLPRSGVGKACVTVPDAPAFCGERRPLRHIYFIDHGDCISVRNLAGQQALASLLSHTFLLDVAARSRLAEHFEQLAHLAARGCCSRLQYPRCFESLPQVRQRVLAHTRSFAAAGA
jgi:hypothetical protein